MEFTGERVIPGRTDPDLFNEHLARYRFAETLVSGQRVLDAGCGMGYGSELLSRRAAVVYSLDLAREPLDWAQGEYSDARVRFVQGSCAHLPFRDRELDIIAAFEVIEHLHDWKGLLSEARRVLREDGQLLVSTPNRPYYEQSRAEPNEFHVHEFDYEEFRRELEAVFPHVTIFFENHTQAISFRAATTEGVRTALDGEPPAPDSSHFFLAVCSGKPQFGAPAFLYVPQSGNVLREKEHHIALLEGELRQKSKWLETATAELDELAAKNQQEQDKAQRAVDSLEQELAEKIAWAEQQDAAVAEARLQLERMESEFAERTEWARKLELDYREALANYAWLESETQGARDTISELEARVVERTEWAQSLDAELERLRGKIQQLYASPAYRIASKLRLAPPPSR